MNKVTRLSCVLILSIILLAGSVFAIPVNAETVNPETDTVTISISNADIRDIISAVPSFGYNIILSVNGSCQGIQGKQHEF